MAIAAFGDVGKQIIDALGLTGKIRRITITYDVDSVVTVEADQLLEEGGHERLVAILKRQDWKFEVQDPPEPPEPTQDLYGADP